MSNKKYQVFVSSTFKDLSDERSDAIRSILDLNHIPAGMELFPAADVDQLAYIKKVIDECDYYILIIGGRYGSIDNEGISYTEREYDYAVQQDKVVLAFVHDDVDLIPGGKTEKDPERFEALKRFRDKVETGRLVKRWTSRAGLESMLLKSLLHAFNAFPKTGWIRGNHAATEDVMERMNSLLTENAKLKDDIAKLHSISKPKFDDIAELDDSLSLTFETRRHFNNAWHYQHNRRSIQWKELFIAVARNLSRPTTDKVIQVGFESMLKDEGTRHAHCELIALDKAKIKAQLIALGLISSHIANSKAGTVEEFLSLTPLGSDKLLELLVQRRSSDVTASE
jgi:Domain of unknown function (DUF4062)